MCPDGVSCDCRKGLLEVLDNGSCEDANLQEFSELLIANSEFIPTLYRFSPADYNNIRALETNKLFLSKAGTMNDIFEGLSGYADEEMLKHLEQLGDLAFLKCFTEKHDNLLMWAHYADNYAGMCVAYDFTQAQELLLRHLFPVVYKKERFSHQPLKYAHDDLANLKRALEDFDSITEENALLNVMSAFLVKSEAWKEEYEWRILYTYSHLYLTSENVGKGNAFYHELVQSKKGKLFTSEELLCLPAPPITDVYLGPKMPQHIKDHIKEIAKARNICVHEMQMDKEKYALTEAY